MSTIELAQEILQFIVKAQSEATAEAQKALSELDSAVELATANGKFAGTLDTLNALAEALNGALSK